MKKVHVIAGAALAGLGLLAQVQAQTSNLLLELVMVGIPQTTVVRDRLDKDKYYLCWTDGTTRYGVKFSRRSFDSRLTKLAPGSRTALSSVAPLDPGGWTASDEVACWGR